ncbi:MAG: bifunctional diaminohydroxyphosphoribosylaminopyrimidine deaminase/5-amino-6-(5-phosphoribosylamino)uracil reductase RibD [Bacteroidales bacterium]|jgi:diaminohydroxyphosphoribosylaminopyrimidine deaminase/5-amino-6-(5-phosphoribosylamino)uracil reductase|nr:bifunctional diaminohydroxyphosphoribosylaminopyrimidine deaminase/5-amino-6-(5-phosphoribosylamino)uracil reductase RibD [Bacteroidales bacterium]
MIETSVHHHFMNRALQLAALGLGGVQPNPMVGAVIVCENRIIGEGYHQHYGQAHAEVMAIQQVHDSSLLPKSTLYVTLEPCSHFGKTPPCADLVIKSGIPRVVVANIDPNDKVNGAGIQKLQAAGIEVICGIMEKEALSLNRRFFTFHQKKRPYIILKWAETANGFMDINRTEQQTNNYWITNEPLRLLNHKWRSEEDAILIGYNTLLNDHPQLTNRLYSGKSPRPFVMSRSFGKEDATLRASGFQALPLNVDEALAVLYEQQVQSVIVEGGKSTLNRFISCGLWDEMRVFVGDVRWEKGVAAPPKLGNFRERLQVEDDEVLFYYCAN